jgi:hypothetical protein
MEISKPMQLIHAVMSLAEKQPLLLIIKGFIQIKAKEEHVLDTNAGKQLS